ncbi:MAG: SurA N-terminal domain-containing protein [Proteobacteria bacterium]|nr:SurA N-terminal domain-containing protein [Pseudomonadota bacterium]
MLEMLRRNAGSWGIKIAFGIIIVVFVFAFGMGSFTEKKEPVVAYVGGEPISAREFQRAFEDSITAMRRQNPGISAEELNTPQFKQAILGQLVNTRLMLSAAAKMGITVSPAELRSVISKIPAFHNAQNTFDPGIYKNALAQNHSTPARFEAELKDNQIIQKLQGYTTISALLTEPEAKGLYQWARETVRMDYVLFPAKDFEALVKPTDQQVADLYEATKEKYKEPARIRLEYLPVTVAELASTVKVSDEDIKKDYDAGIENFKHPAQMQARHILLLVQPSAPQEVADKAQAQIKDIQAQLKKGASFEALAKKYSQDPVSAAKGGELPWFSQGTMVKPFEDAALTLKPGQVSEPVRTQYGWHIIKLMGNRPAGTVPFDQVKDDIKKRLAEEKASEKSNEILDQSMDQIAAGVKLAKIAQGLGLTTRKSEMMDQQEVQRTFGLKKEAVDTMFALAPGSGAKTPLAMEPARGYLLAEKIEGTPEAILPLDKVRDKVVAEVKVQEARKLAMEKAQKVLAELQNPETQAKALASVKADFKTTPPLDRQAAQTQPGSNPQMLAAIFAAGDHNWLKQPYEVPAGVALARLAERIPAPEATWEKEKRIWISQGAQAFSQELFNALLTNLRESVKVEIVRQDLLN